MPGDDHLSVAPTAADAAEGRVEQEGADAGSFGGRSDRQDAGRDRSIEKRLQKNPDSSDARLDSGLDESMDASDPISVIQPGHSSDEPPASSGYDPEAEQERTGGA